MGHGIDYGLGKTNVDTKNGIRYGVIHQHEVLQAWADSSEPYYPCEECDKAWDLEQEDDTGLWYITGINADPGPFETEDDARDYMDDKTDAFGCDFCEPLSWYYNKDGYQADQDSMGDIFITKSPYYTRAAFCSPCAPGACYLTDPCKDGERAYCFGHNWFYDTETGKAPYPVYRVADDTLVD
jgi:hypothetical protein